MPTPFRLDPARQRLLQRRGRRGNDLCRPGHTPTSLLSALQAWANATGSGTTIKVAGGIYPISVSLQQLTEPASPLTLLGGYAPNTNCDDGQRNIVAHATILDGGSNGVFALEPDSTTLIDGITLQNFIGVASSPSVAAITAWSS